MPRLFFFLVLLCMLPASLFASESPLWNALTLQQQEQLTAGKPVLLEEEIADNPWPRFTVYHLVKSSPAQAVAVFWDCELDSKYVPNCLSVHIVSAPEPWIHEGEYSLKMPMFLPDEVYVSRNELKVPAPDIYEISWNVLHAHYIKGSTGNIRIEPHGEGALIRYTNLVKPGSSIASLLRGEASDQVVESVKALVRQIEMEIQSSPQLLDQQLQKMTADLPISH
jgi:hypothetical protein